MIKKKEELEMSWLRWYYLPGLVEFIKLFLRNHLIRQEEFKTQEEYEKAVCENYVYYLLDIACHEFAVGETFPLSGRIRSFEQDPVEIYGRQDAIMGIEDDNGEVFDFEIDKTNYRKYRKKAEKIIGDRIFFSFEVNNVISPNHTQGKVISL